MKSNFEQAEEALARIFGDSTVPMVNTREQLENLSALIDDYLNTLPEE